MWTFWKLLPALLAAPSAAQRVLELSSVGWTATNGVNATVKANFPTQIHLDLYREGITGDPLYNYNDVNQLWVANSNWTFTSSPLPGLSKHFGTSSWLIFDGLDTFAEVTLCDEFVANTDNQYLQYVFDVSDIVRKCSKAPVLKLNFGSAPKIAIELGQSGQGFVNFYDSVGTAEFDGKEYLRKEQNDFGWDWSPKISPTGPWRDARIVQLAPGNPVHVNNVMMDVYRKGQMNNLPPDQSQPWVFNASVDFVGTLNRPQMHLTLRDKTGRMIKQTALGNISRNNMTVTGSVEITEDVDLWWPNELGDQTMYEATVTITDMGSWHGGWPTTVTKQIGFRTIVWNGTPITEEQLAKGIAPGSNWHFEINGKEFFAKGANLVPPDVFWARVTEDHMRELFGLAKAGHYNMLRVWASGVYMADWIYDLADEMGLLLWSEFEFSDGVYPNTTSYLENYEKEAYYNTRRLNHHPSLAFWTGGNELESIILAFVGKDSEGGLAYQQIQTELLIKCVYANSRSISYIPSSTYNGYVGDIDYSAVQPMVPRWDNTSTPAGAYYSDVDTYNYDASQAFTLKDYPVGRFVNEFGFISMPSVQTWEKAVPSDQLYFLSPSVVHHNNHGGAGFGQNVTTAENMLLGMEQMVTAVDMWYPRPNLADSVANFTMWCYSTQVYHADYYASLIASFRRGSGQPQRTLGSLYWQLEDLWAAPTWATVESDNRPKVPYYSTKDIYQPLIIWAYYHDDTDAMEIAVTSDRFESVSGSVTMKWMDFEGNSLRLSKPDTGSMNPTFTVGAVNSTTVATYENVTSLFNNHTATATNALLYLSVKSDDGQYSHSSYFHPAPLKDAALKDPGLKLQYVGHNQFKVTATKAVAATVWVDYPSTVRGAFDFNGFWLNKGESRTVTFTVWEDMSRGQWSKGVKVWSVWNSYDK